MNVVTGGGGGLIDFMRGLNLQLEAVERWYFFSEIFKWIDEEIAIFRDNLIVAMGEWVGGIALVLLTLWILLQGYRIVTGRSRQFMMELVVDSLKWVLIVSIATTFTMSSSSIHQLLTSDMPETINRIVTGSDEGPADAIDSNLQEMELAMVAIDSLDGGWSDALESAKTKALWFTGIGVAGPSLIGGTILLMYKMAMALFVGFGPFFILCLGFDQTKGMFQKWAWYGIGTMFSLAVLSFCVAMISELVRIMAEHVAAQYLVAAATGGSAEGISTMSMQQGGLGMLMTLFLITVPPMAAAFFQGTLGHYMPYSAFGQQQAQPVRPGQPGTPYYPVGGQVAAPPAAQLPASSQVVNPTHSHRVTS